MHAVSEQDLWRYLDGEMSAAQAESIEAAAQKDEELRRRLDEMRAMKQEVLAGAPEPSPGFAERVSELAMKRAATPVIDLADARRFLRRALVAAAILGAVGLAYLAFGVIPDLLDPPQIQANPLLGGK